MPGTAPHSQRDQSEIDADAASAALTEYGAHATLEENASPALNGRSVGSVFDNNHAGLDAADPSELAAQETDADTMGSDADLNLVEQLRRDYAQAQERAEELQELLTEAMRKEQLRDEEQKEIEALVEEKSDLIRQLHVKLQQVQVHQQETQDKQDVQAHQEPQAHHDVQSKPAAATPREEELLALHEELEQERRQLKDDEEALMQQMRQMEVTMSRDRAEVARQRSELQRLHNDIHHELELAAREASLRDRLQPLQRRHQEMVHRKGGEPRREGAPTPTRLSANGNGDAEHKPDKASEGGLFRRLFG